MSNTRLLIRLTVFASLAIVSCSPTKETETMPTNAKYAEGQVWKYKTRPGEEGSLLVIGRITETVSEPTYGIYITGVKVKNPYSPSGFQEVLPHAPVTDAVLDTSVTERVDTTIALDGFDDGYDEWKSAYDADKGGVFTIPVSEIVEAVEFAVAQSGGSSR
jgi:hypothetical protein